MEARLEIRGSKVEHCAPSCCPGRIGVEAISSELGGAWDDGDTIQHLLVVGTDDMVYFVMKHVIAAKLFARPRPWDLMLPPGDWAPLSPKPDERLRPKPRLPGVKSKTRRKRPDPPDSPPDL